MTENEIFDAMLDEAWDEHDELLAYRAIGTVEQLEWCKDASHWKELFKEKLEQYEAIGTVEECRVAVEKMKPKKAKGLRICNQACCPNCNTVILDDEFWMLDEYTYYCDSCGQAVKGIDWSE